MLFADGTQILQCKPSISGTNGIRYVRDSIEQGHVINTQLIHDEDAFLSLIKHWIEPCVSLMRKIDPSVPDIEKVRLLFYHDDNLKGQKDFLDCFISFIKGYDPYTMDVWPTCSEASIIEKIDRVLEGAQEHMKLRVKVICLLGDCMPNRLFSEGDWSATFLPDLSKDEIMEIKSGEKWILSLFCEGVQKLIPKTLHNNSSNPCEITIFYGEISYPITLPPYGFLRVMFSDAECKCLACVKGNLSFNNSIAQNALIHLPSVNGSQLYFYHSQNQHATPIMQGPYTDASVDGEGGAKILKGKIIYDFTHGKTLEQTPLPVRLYGAGCFWAEQMADGSLKTNMMKNGQEVKKAWSIVEDADRSLLFADDEGTWRCIGTNAKKISDQEFVDCMLGRFISHEYSECVSTPVMKLCIDKSGRLL